MEQQREQENVQTTPYTPTTHDQILNIFNTIAPYVDKDKDFLYDFGAGDGRVIFHALVDYGIRAAGVEWDRTIDPLYPHLPIKYGGMLQLPMPKETTIVFMNLITQSEANEVLYKVKQELGTRSSVKLIISATRLQGYYEDKLLIATLQPPKLEGHILMVYGSWDNIAHSTLHEMRKDSWRNTYAKVQDQAMTADETFYVYKL